MKMLRTAVLGGLLLLSCSEKKPPAGPAWTKVLTEIPGGAILAGTVVDGQVFAVGGYRGRGMVLRWDGEQWAEMPGVGPNPLWWIWGARADSLYAVGDGGTILHWDGAAWSRMSTARADPKLTFWGVWGAADDDVWAVGGSPFPDGPTSVLYHWDGRRWLPVPAPEGVEASLFKVWGSSSRAVWVVGERGTILFWNGGAWSKVPSPVQDTLTGIWGVSASEAYVAGGLMRGLVLRYDGAGWSVLADDLPYGSTGVWMGSEHVLHVSGWSGMLGRIEDGSFVAAPAVTAYDLHSLWGSDDVGVFTGSADLRSAQGSEHASELFHYPGAFPSTDVTVAPIPDGGWPDASEPDAAAYDGGAAAGEVCSSGATCGPGLDCWTFAFLAPPEDYCTHDCTRALDCVGEFGEGSCCRTPGPQTTRTVCYTASLGMCP